MHADWYLVQITADLRRHEPRNIGVVLNVGEQWILRFRGVDRSGKINGRLLRGIGVSKSTYQSWIEYFARKAHTGRWSEALSIPEKRPSNFSAIHGGTIMEIAGEPRFLADRLFSEMVTLPEKPIQAPLDLARHVLAEAQIEVHERILLPGRWDLDTPEVPIPFDFGLGEDHRVTLEALSPNPLAISYLRTRIDAVERVGKAPRIIAMLPLNRADRDLLDDLLRPVEQHAGILDLDASNAANELQAMVS
ncbi:hypothetical protein [Glutamicibacter protophormiae]|uniref:Uncharacterized protein n=1 Tax=Glutamicibacter protophormiae TaxID=37930 RepID=A0ABS4XQT1_GLUPR|nr:hypothetical protein [Glutamicibacter protophormiae]MBP2398869.1 hypothetical protein [Glutamicibacter protophormiae]GGL83162.1 hypothetical protein GCM10010038_11360 [Glutamicibacter protophormiae]